MKALGNNFGTYNRSPSLEAGGTCCYIDFENAIVPGMPPWCSNRDDNKFVLLAPETLEDGLKVMYMLAEVDLIV